MFDAPLQRFKHMLLCCSLKQFCRWFEAFFTNAPTLHYARTKASLVPNDVVVIIWSLVECDSRDLYLMSVIDDMRGLL